MSNEAFIRKYELTIGRNRELITNIRPPETQYVTRRNRVDDIWKVGNSFALGNPDARFTTAGPRGATLPDGSYKDFTTIPPASITITDLHMEAVIEDNKNTDKTSSQETEIRIYNLSKESREFIKAGDSVILKAGYRKDKELPLLFVGQIVSVETKTEVSNKITYIFVKPAKIANDVKVYKSYPPKTTVGEVIDDLVSIATAKGIPTGEVFKNESALSIRNKVYPFGCSVRGNLMEALETVCADNYMRAYVVLGRLYVEPKNLSQYTKIVTILPENVKTNLQREEDETIQESFANSKPSGVSTTLFLNGNITTNAIARIKAEPYTGDYLIKSVKHTLSYEGNSWDTEVHCSKGQS